jgi:hypothetical protein
MVENAEPPQTRGLSDLANHVVMRDLDLRDFVAEKVMQFFRVSLFSTIGLTIILSAVDAAFIFFKIITPVERLVNERVLMAIVGATIVQVGAATGTIVIFLFKARKEGPLPQETVGD